MNEARKKEIRLVIIIVAVCFGTMVFIVGSIIFSVKKSVQKILELINEEKANIEFKDDIAVITVSLRSGDIGIFGSKFWAGFEASEKLLSKRTDLELSKSTNSKYSGQMIIGPREGVYIVLVSYQENPDKIDELFINGNKTILNFK